MEISLGIFNLILLVVPFVALYFVIKSAVRNGMIEAHEIIKARENRF